MNNKSSKLIDVTFRINAIYDNGDHIKILGFTKNSETKERRNITATIWKLKKSQTKTMAYKEFEKINEAEDGLLLTSGSDLNEYNGHSQYTIRKISGFIKSKYKNTQNNRKEKNEY